jgi:hypothetical protein
VNSGAVKRTPSLTEAARSGHKNRKTPHKSRVSTQVWYSHETLPQEKGEI